MAILVAGGAGYIGSHTCVELLNRGYEVVVVDNLYNSSEVALDRVKEITGKSLKFYKGDILSREDLEHILEKRFKGQVLELNRRAFAMGCEAAAEKGGAL